MNLKRSRRYRRGYPVAILVGFEDDYAVLWNVFSRVVKQSSNLKLEGKRTDEKVLYNFHQSVVEALKHLIKEGIKSIIVTAPQKTTYTSDFIKHVQKHHRYLLNNKSPNRTNFAELEGSANNFIAIAELIKSKKFTDLLFKTTSEEADHIVGILEKCLYANKKYDSIMYTLKEIENTVIAKKKNDEMGTEYLLLTDKYLSENMSKNRIHRLMQMANNKNIKTRIIDIESSAGSRISQFGGIVFFSTSSSN